MSACNVTFWKKKDFTDKYKNYDGARNVPDLEQVNWQGSNNDMKDDISGIQTSSQTWIRVYSKPNYSGRTALVGPNTSINMVDLWDDNHEDNMDDTIESFQLYDHPPTVNTSNIARNFRALYPGSVYSSLHNLWNVEFYAQDVKYRIYDPTMLLSSTGIDFTINLDHVQLESDDHAVVTFSMDFYGNFTKQISIRYDMANAAQIPDWVIKLIDGAIDVAAKTAKLIADGAEIVITDGVGVVATVETNKLIDYTAKALSFCVDHVNSVLAAAFKLQDDGGTTYFPAIVSHSIARLVQAYYQELYGTDTNRKMDFNQGAFFAALDAKTWDESKENPFVEFSYNTYTYRAYFPDNSFLYAHGGAVSSVKVDAVTGQEIDDHLILQAGLDPNGRLYSVVGCMDIFLLRSFDGYSAPTSGVLTYDASGQMVQISKDGSVTPIHYNSLAEAYLDLMYQAWETTRTTYNFDSTQQQAGLVNASSHVLAAIVDAIG